MPSTIKSVFSGLCLFFLMIPLVHGAISIQESDISRQDAQINLSTMIANREEVIREDLRLTYALVRSQDNAVIKSAEERFALAPREVKTLDAIMSLPDELYGGTYFVNVVIRSPTGAPLAGFTHRFSHSGAQPPYVIADGPYLKAGGQEPSGIPIESYGTTGANIPQDANYSLHFSLEPTRSLEEDMSVRTTITPTYGEEQVYESEQSLDTRGIAETTAYNVTPDFSEPGTYRVTAHFLDADGDTLFTKTVRMVIEGKGASLLRVDNRQDTYASEEEVSLSVDYVGAADGATIIEDAQMVMEVSKDGQEINTITRDIDRIGFSVETMEISYHTPVALEEYTVQLSLRDEEEVFDSVTLDYEPLEPEQIITADGRVYDPNRQGCFDDGVCTEQEEAFGQCYDCLAPDEEKDETKQQKLDEALDHNRSDTAQPRSDKPADTGVDMLIYAIVMVVLALLVGGYLYVSLQRGGVRKR